MHSGALLPDWQTKEAQNRMEEMRQLIGKRLGEGTPRSRAQSILESSSSSSFSRSSDTSSKVEQISGSIDELVTEADYYLSQAVKNQPLIESDVQSMAAQLKEVGYRAEERPTATEHCGT